MTCYVLSVDGGRVSLSVNPRLVNTHLSSGDIKPGMVGNFFADNKHTVSCLLVSSPPYLDD